MELQQLTIKQAHEGLKKKEFSSLDLTKACFGQIKKVEKKLNAFITQTENQALIQAQATDKKGDFSQALTGVPVGIKDIFCTRGVQTTAGSKILGAYKPPYSSTVIDRLAGQDSIMLGKLNMDEFACGSSTETSYFGPTKNPWDTQRVPGGSSGGSAAAVAADECMYALGTDTGGSIRQPASLCGVVGLKPTYGRVSRYGVIAMASSLDQVGPVTKTVEDAALVLQQIAGKDKYDATTVDQPVPDYSANLNQSIKNLKIGVPKEFFGAGLDPKVGEQVKAAISQLERLGATIEEVSLPHSKYALAVYYIIMPSELSANLERYDGIRYGFTAKAKTLMENYLQTRGQGFGDEIKRRIMLGTYSLSSGYYDAYYAQAQKVRTVIKKEFEEIFKKVDCLVGPTSPTVAFKIGERVDDPLSMYLVDIYTVPVNIAGLPGLSVPCGFADGMPVGLQIIGKQFDEATILGVGHQYQQATEWQTKKPTL